MTHSAQNPEFVSYLQTNYGPGTKFKTTSGIIGIVDPSFDWRIDSHGDVFIRVINGHRYPIYSRTHYGWAKVIK